MTFIDNFNYIFIPNVLNFRKPYGTINRGFPFQADRLTRGRWKSMSQEISAVKLNQVGLSRRITLIVVNWRLHIVAEIYPLTASKCEKI
jgi:hypothetical protein